MAMRSSLKIPIRYCVTVSSSILCVYPNLGLWVDWSLTRPHNGPSQTNTITPAANLESPLNPISPDLDWARR